MDILKVAEFVENKLAEDGYTSKDVGRVWFQITRNNASVKEAHPDFYLAIEKYIKEYYKKFCHGRTPEYTPGDVFCEITM